MMALLDTRRGRNSDTAYVVFMTLAQFRSAVLASLGHLLFGTYLIPSGHLRELLIAYLLRHRCSSAGLTA